MLEKEMAAHGSISQVRLHCGRARGTSVQPRGYRLWKPFRKLRVLAWFDMKLIDHRYEYELLAGFWTSIQAAVSILINLPSALVVGARLMADVGLAQSGLETAGISKLVRHYALVIQLFYRNILSRSFSFAVEHILFGMRHG